MLAPSIYISASKESQGPSKRKFWKEKKRKKRTNIVHNHNHLYKVLKPSPFWDEISTRGCSNF